jgi:hypothetical protein
MRNSGCFWLRYAGISALLAAQGMSMLNSSRAECYTTPRMALDALVANSSFSTTLRTDGYRVTRIESDQVLGRRWAMIARCGHSEWPVSALPANGESLPTSPQEGKRSVSENLRTVPMIRVGDVVRLWRQESLLRIEVAGVSEESGGLGKTIRVRLLHGGTDDQSMPQKFSGVIRGPANVEMQP